ncbi:MAG: 8-amino-7-oxononanoate synthase [Candidatus Dormibacteria bacterium]|jgi:8-amino-7-oxononanoate synthase
MPPSAPLDWAAETLLADQRGGLLRRLREREGGSWSRGEVDGRAVVVFSSNDYLGLSVHPAVREAASLAALELGVGATGSRHLSGGHRAIADLEEALAGFLGARTATVAPSGYAANIAILEALGGPDATILSDAGNHASLIDGCRASRSRVAVYRHLDSADLGARLAGAEGRPIIVTDSVFSMDGAAADLVALDRLARRHGAWLVVDEAHALGTTGPGGRGLAAELGVAGDHVVRVVTFSKALGAAGAAVCGSEPVRRLLLQRGRALIFSTALPHPTVAAARAALGVLMAEPELVLLLHERAGLLRRRLGGLALPGAHPSSPIVAVMVGDPIRTMELDQALWERGYLVQGIRPPTVEPGTSRLRLVAGAVHTEAEIEGVAAALTELLST